MTFALKIPGMLSFASCAVLAATVAASGCIATSPVEFSETQNYPPSVVSQETAEYPLREIGRLDLDAAVGDELPLRRHPRPERGSDSRVPHLPQLFDAARHELARGRVYAELPGSENQVSGANTL